MKKILLAAVVAFVSFNVEWSEAHAQADVQVIGGSEAGSTEYPWMASLHLHLLEDNGLTSLICAGSLIDPQWVLTASHCVSIPPFFYENNPPLPDIAKPYFVRVGTNLVNSSGQVRQVAEIVIGTRGFSFTDDIALLRLESPVEGVTPIQRVSASEGQSAVSLGSATVIGWGTTNFGTETGIGNVLPAKLQKGLVDTFSDDQCSSTFGTQFDPDKSICADTLASDDKGTGAVGACYGDSGGPLVVTLGGVQKVMGITSGGFDKCGSDKYPGIYTKVASYDDWISKTINPNSRIKTIASVILDKLDLALSERKGASDVGSIEDQVKAADRIDKQNYAVLVIRLYLDSLITTARLDRKSLQPRYKSISIKSLKDRRRRLNTALSLAYANRLGTGRRKAILQDSRVFFESLQ